MLGRGADEITDSGDRDTLLEEVLISGGGELAGIVDASLVLGGRANLLERGNGHGGEKADDDHDDHDFNERETLVLLLHDDNTWDNNDKKQPASPATSK